MNNLSNKAIGSACQLKQNVNRKKNPYLSKQLMAQACTINETSRSNSGPGQTTGISASLRYGDAAHTPARTTSKGFF